MKEGEERRVRATDQAGGCTSSSLQSSEEGDLLASWFSKRGAQGSSLSGDGPSGPQQQGLHLAVTQELCCDTAAVAVLIRYPVIKPQGKVHSIVKKAEGRGSLCK